MTQGSRGAVKARRYFSIRYADHCWEALHLPACWERRGRSRRPSRTSKALRHAKRCRVQGAPAGDTRVRHCVRWPAVTTRAACEHTVRERSGRTPHRARRARCLALRERRQAARITHRLRGGALQGVLLRTRGGGRLRLLCRRYLRWQRSGERATRRSPSYLTGRAAASIAAAHGRRTALATLRLPQAYRSCVKRRTGTLLQTR